MAKAFPKKNPFSDVDITIQDANDVTKNQLEAALNPFSMTHDVSHTRSNSEGSMNIKRGALSVEDPNSSLMASGGPS